MIGKQIVRLLCVSNIYPPSFLGGGLKEDKVKTLNKIVLFFLLLSGCEIQTQTKPTIEKINQEYIHFLEWNGYLGYYENESPFIQFLFLMNNKLNSNFAEHINSISVVDNKGHSYAVKNWNILKGGFKDSYSLKTLSVRLPPIKEGNTYLNKISISFGDNKPLEWSIGNVLLDVQQGSDPNLLTLGKKTSLSVSPFIDWYQVELTNIHSEKINIDGLEVKIPGKEVDVTTEMYTSFDTTQIVEGLPELDPNETQTFRFNFNLKENQEMEFFIIRPFVIYKTKGGKVYKQTLGLAGYTPRLTEKQAKDLLNLD